MIKTSELRIGNRVYWNPRFVQSNATIELMQIEITAILTDKIGYVSPMIELRVEPFEDDLLTKETPYEPLEEINPIPLTEEWLQKFPSELKYPTWIKYVHELQNWYFWNHDKHELPIKE